MFRRGLPQEVLQRPETEMQPGKIITAILEQEKKGWNFLFTIAIFHFQLLYDLKGSDVQRKFPFSI